MSNDKKEIENPINDEVFEEFQEQAEALDNLHLDRTEDFIKQIQQHQTEITKLEEKILRSAAEHDNIRKRMQKQIDDAFVFSITNFSKDLMNVMDNLTRTIEYAKVENSDPLINNLIEGVKLTKSELNAVFEKYGIVTITPQTGDKFDYNQHQAVAHIENDQYEPGIIINVMQSGYLLKDRLLRPAMVSVAKKSDISET